MSFGIGAVAGGLGTGLANWDREERQIRRDNARAFQEYVGFAKENGLDPDPTELSKVAEQITGGSNWQMAALPGQKVREQISQRLKESRSQKRSAEQLQQLQIQQTEENIFGGIVDGVFEKGGSLEDVEVRLKDRFGDNPDMIQRVGKWMAGQNMDQRRSTFAATKVNELAKNLSDFDTEESVRSRYKGMAPEIVDGLALVAKTNQLKRTEDQVVRLTPMLNTYSHAFYDPNTGRVRSPAELTSQLRAILPEGTDPTKFLAAAQSIGAKAAMDTKFAMDTNTRQNMAANASLFTSFQASLERDPALLQSIITNGGEFTADGKERLRRLAKERFGVDLLDQDFDFIRAGAVSARWEQLTKSHKELVFKATEAADQDWTDVARKSSAAITNSIAAKTKDVLSKNTADLIAQRFFVGEGNDAALVTIASTIKKHRDAMGSSASPAEVANAVTADLAQQGIPQINDAKRGFVERRARAMAGPPPQTFQAYYSQASQGQQAALGDFDAHISSATTVEDWVSKRQTVLAKVKGAIRDYDQEEALASRGHFLGFDREAFNNLRSRMVQYRDQLERMQPPPTMPRTREDLRRLDAEANRAKPTQAPQAVDPRTSWERSVPANVVAQDQAAIQARLAENKSRLVAEAMADIDALQKEGMSADEAIAEALRVRPGLTRGDLK